MEVNSRYDQMLIMEVDNMKKTASRVFALMMVFMVAVSMMIMPVPQKTLAGSGEIVKYKKSIGALTDSVWQINMGKKLKGATKVTVKSSNKKIAKQAFKWDKDSGKYLFIMTGSKKGTAKLTIKVTTKKGTSKYKCTIKTYKYKNPLKALKIGKKNIASKYKKQLYYETGELSKGSHKISVTPASGWKVRKIVYSCYDFEKDKANDTKIKNGGSVKIKANGDEYYETVQIVM